MEISIVSLAYHLQMDDSGEIENTGISIGSVAPNIPFAEQACNYLHGKKYKNLTPFEREEFAIIVLKYASPISDIRASEWYRKEVLHNICREF